ncbi:MAG: hypothetical protein A2Y00_01860 [Omnitrophica WOR_2 bacterium GWF2_43_52]|nr:MAG: hypothetical protein A2Y00_01860 [Omnitrophica WOR_2 bacterium GWF2_43_52]
MGTAAWAAPVSSVYQSPCLGAGLLWRSLGRSLLANLKACAARQAGCRPRPAASRRVLTSTSLQQKRTVFNKRIRSLSACAMLKKSFGRRYAEPLSNNA